MQGIALPKPPPRTLFAGGRGNRTWFSETPKNNYRNKTITGTRTHFQLHQVEPPPGGAPPCTATHVPPTLLP
jgi:hypothetical protein